MLTVKNLKLVIGYDLGREFSQISFFSSKAAEPQTVSTIAGYEQYNIPTVLAKKTSSGQWFYGREALRVSKEDDCILVDDLIYKAERGEEVLVDGEGYDPAALLTLFVKRSLSLLETEMPLRDLDAFLFTVEDLTPRLVEVLGRVAAALSLKCELVTYQSHLESFYSYMLHQPEELRLSDVMIFEYHEHLKTLLLSVNHRTRPRVCLIRQKDYDTFKRREFDTDEAVRSAQKKSLDEAFLKLLPGELSDHEIGTVYLLGDGFKEDWMDESLKVLLKNRRAFMGNNLYSKGACYAVMEKLVPTELSEEYVYLGPDKLKSNIGLSAKRRGEDSYFAVIDAGSNWYEAKKDFQMILEEGNEIAFLVTSLTGGHVVQRTIELDGLPERPMRTTRLSFHLEMTDVNTLEIDIEDLGFGEIVKSSGLAWSHTLEL